MSTDLVVINENTSFDDLADLLGLGGGGGSTLPALKINLAPDVEIVNAAGIKQSYNLVRGSFYVRQDGENVYSDGPVTFRAYFQRTDYREYDATANSGKGAFVKRSILANKGEEPLDDAGTIACCKLRGAAAKGVLSPEQQLIQQKVKTCRVVFGTVSYAGKTAQGREVEIEELPVELRLQGSNFMGIEDFFKKVQQTRVMPMTIPLTLTTQRQQKGSTVYFVIQYDYDFNRRLPLADREGQNLRSFLEYCAVYNAEIIAAHKSALKARSADPFANDALDDDFGLGTKIA